MTICATMHRVLALLACSVAPAQAQTVELRLREDPSQQPVAGAIVRLLRNDSVVSQALTNELGMARLRGGLAGIYRLRIDRIGFAGFLTRSFELDTGIFRFEVPIASVAVSLPEVIVREGRSPCDTRPEDGALAAILWEEIRKALTANILTQEDQSIPLLVRHFERELASTGKPLREWVFRSALTRGQPFVALPAQQLAKVGFVYLDRDTVAFAAPDARLLLSDEFVATHCFRAVPGPLNRIGLAFEPVPNRSLPDVSGTLWVNRLTSELQELEFEYTGLAKELIRSELGGRIEFRRLPVGSWIISYWHVRMPLLESFERYRVRRATETITRVAGLLERGGRVTIATGESGLGDRAVLIGRVFDSTSAAGLAGAIITVADGIDSAVTGPDGQFELAVVASGPILVTASHPKLIMARAAGEREVVLSLGDTTRTDFAVPPLAALARSRCGTPGRRAGVIGMAWGPDGVPDRTAHLLASWRTPTGTVRTEGTRTDQRGGYAFCDLPPDQPVSIRLQRGTITLSEATVRLGWAEFQWLDLRAGAP